MAALLEKKTFWIKISLLSIEFKTSSFAQSPLFTILSSLKKGKVKKHEVTNYFKYQAFSIYSCVFSSRTDLYLTVFHRFQIYTDESHLLNGGNTRTHLYNSMEDFLLNCYGKTRVPEEVVEEEVEKDDEEFEER